MRKQRGQMRALNVGMASMGSIGVGREGSKMIQGNTGGDNPLP